MKSYDYATVFCNFFWKKFCVAAAAPGEALNNSWIAICVNGCFIGVLNGNRRDGFPSARLSSHCYHAKLIWLGWVQLIEVHMNITSQEEQQMNTTRLNHHGQFSQMKARKRPLTFGDFVAGACRTWGERRAIGIVQLALKAHVIEFRGTERFVIS